MKNPEIGLHPVVAGAAELSAEDSVRSRLHWCEVDVQGLAGKGILLEAHLGYGETVDDILSVEAQVYFAIGGKDQLGGDDVVSSAGVGGVDADWVAFARRDELRVSAAKGGVCAGIAEVPGKLHARNFNLERGGIGARVADGGPEDFGLDGQGGKEDDEEAQWKVFDDPVTARFASTTAGEQADEQDQVHEGEQRGGDVEVQEEMMVELRTVRGCVGR